MVIQSRCLVILKGVDFLFLYAVHVNNQVKNVGAVQQYQLHGGNEKQVQVTDAYGWRL